MRYRHKDSHGTDRINSQLRGNYPKEKSLENVVFSRLLVAEGVGFEPTWAEAQTVFKAQQPVGN